MVKYWVKIISSNENSITKKIYMMLKHYVDVGRNYNGKNWAFQIKEILQTHGFSNVWNSQFILDIPVNLITQRILDMYFQSWFSEINNSRRLEAYSIFKYSFEFEKYLDHLKEPKYRIHLQNFKPYYCQCQI